MISTICLCVFSVMFTVQAQPQYEAFGEVEKLKNHVISISNELASFEKDLMFRHYKKLSERKVEHYEMTNLTMTYTLMQLKNATLALTVDGHKITHCYESAKKSLNNESQVTFRKIDSCSESQLHIINPVLVKIQNHLQDEKSILQDLNSILLQCSSGTKVHVISCVEWEIEAAAITVELYESPVEPFIHLGSILAYKGDINHFRCADPVMSNFYYTLYEVKQNFNKCVKNADEF